MNFNTSIGFSEIQTNNDRSSTVIPPPPQMSTYSNFPTMNIQSPPISDNVRQQNIYDDYEKKRMIQDTNSNGYIDEQQWELNKDIVQQTISEMLPDVNSNYIMHFIANNMKYPLNIRDQQQFFSKYQNLYNFNTYILDLASSSLNTEVSNRNYDTYDNKKLNPFLQPTLPDESKNEFNAKLSLLQQDLETHTGANKKLPSVKFEEDISTFEQKNKTLTLEQMLQQREIDNQDIAKNNSNINIQINTSDISSVSTINEKKQIDNSDISSVSFINEKKQIDSSNSIINERNIDISFIDTNTNFDISDNNTNTQFDISDNTFSLFNQKMNELQKNKNVTNDDFSLPHYFNNQYKSHNDNTSDSDDNHLYISSPSETNTPVITNPHINLYENEYITDSLREIIKILNNNYNITQRTQQNGIMTNNCNEFKINITNFDLSSLYLNEIRLSKYSNIYESIPFLQQYCERNIQDTDGLSFDFSLNIHYYDSSDNELTELYTDLSFNILGMRKQNDNPNLISFSLNKHKIIIPNREKCEYNNIYISCSIKNYQNNNPLSISYFSHIDNIFTYDSIDVERKSSISDLDSDSDDSNVYDNNKIACILLKHKFNFSHQYQYNDKIQINYDTYNVLSSAIYSNGKIIKYNPYSKSGNIEKSPNMILIKDEYGYLFDTDLHNMKIYNTTLCNALLTYE